MSRLSTTCSSCGERWENHLGIIGTCAQVRSLRDKLRGANAFKMFAYLTLLPEGVAWTPENLLREMLKIQKANASKKRIDGRSCPPKTPTTRR